ncbi:MAG: hypothetical protein AB1792_08405 [Candidatus Zixiibacteriota bacterium]
MRKSSWVLLAVFLVLGAASLAAAFPHVINYQGILRDAAGKVVADGPHSVTFRFYNDQAAGNKLWEETQSITTKSGLFNALLGSTIEIPDTAFANDSWLGIVVGTDPEMAPRTRVASVGYAYQARNADKLQGLEPGELVYPSTPGRVFRAYASAGGGTTVMLSGPSGRIRQITGIYVSEYSRSGPFDCALIIGGMDAMALSSPDGFASWSSDGGAPIEVGPAESVEFRTCTSVPQAIIVTGFEY